MFLRNNVVMEPLLTFLVENAVASPSTDLQWIAARGIELFKTMLKSITTEGSTFANAFKPLPDEKRQVLLKWAA